MRGKEEANRLWNRHSAPRGGGVSQSSAPGDPKVFESEEGQKEFREWKEQQEKQS